MAYDVCRLDGATAPEALLAIGESGVERLAPLSGTTPRQTVVHTETVLAHARDDGMPRIRLCFSLWPGEPPALVIPTLTGVEIHRQRTVGGFAKVAALRVRAESGFQSGLMRDERERVQRLTLRIEFRT